MGTEAHVIVVGGPRALAAQAGTFVAELERRWSRFLPDSEVCTLNRRTGDTVVVSDLTRVLVRCGVEGWRRSDGWFDPGVHDALVAAGYDRDFTAVVASGSSPVAPAEPYRSPDWNALVVDDAAGTVRLPAGAAFDPGGIGKGLAADLTVAELMAAGAVGACVNLGGDLRAEGRPPDGPAWRIALDTRAGSHPQAVCLRRGAVATSGTWRRRWLGGGVEQHHLIDPRTGVPSATHRVEATVVAATAWEAEVAAKVALLAPPSDSARLLVGLAAGALVVDGPDGSRGDGRRPVALRPVGDIEQFLCDTEPTASAAAGSSL